MTIPSTLPHAVPPLLLIMEIEVVISIPANLEPSRRFSRIVVAGQLDTKMKVLRFDDFDRLEHAMPDKSRTHSLQYRPVYWCGARTIIYRDHLSYATVPSNRQSFSWHVREGAVPQ
jgi:hypothetical protein